MKVLIHRNPHRDPDCSASYRVRDILAARGIDVVISGVGASPFCGADGQPAAAGFDMVVCMGGDGTVLDAAAFAAPLGLPILGINLGNVGFMTAFDSPDGIREILDDGFVIEERGMLEVVYGDKKCLALNDAVLTTDAGRTVGISVSIDGADAYTLRGDGMIAATATGSTAYSMSAGGPVAHPKTGCILLTPVCAHTAHARPFVLPSDSGVSLICDRNVLLCVDGRPSERVEAGDSVNICASGTNCRIVRLKNYSFYDMIKRKLWTV